MVKHKTKSDGDGGPKLKLYIGGKSGKIGKL